MRHYHVRIALLTLGVVLGYGSALAHAYRDTGHAPVHHCTWK